MTGASPEPRERPEGDGVHDASPGQAREEGAARSPAFAGNGWGDIVPAGRLEAMRIAREQGIPRYELAEVFGISEREVEHHLFLLRLLEQHALPDGR